MDKLYIGLALKWGDKGPAEAFSTLEGRRCTSYISYIKGFMPVEINYIVL